MKDNLNLSLATGAAIALAAVLPLLCPGCSAKIQVTGATDAAVEKAAARPLTVGDRVSIKSGLMREALGVVLDIQEFGRYAKVLFIDAHGATYVHLVPVSTLSR